MKLFPPTTLTRFAFIAKTKKNPTLVITFNDLNAICKSKNFHGSFFTHVSKHLICDNVISNRPRETKLQKNGESYTL